MTIGRFPKNEFSSDRSGRDLVHGETLLEKLFVSVGENPMFVESPKISLARERR